MPRKKIKEQGKHVIRLPNTLQQLVAQSCPKPAVVIFLCLRLCLKMPEDSDGVCTCDGASVGPQSWMGHGQVDVTQKEKT